jgi:septum formation protein
MIESSLDYLNSKRIILASASPRRKTALENLGLKFEVIPSSFAENLDKSLFKSPNDYVLETARQKTLNVYNTLVAKREKFDLLIGADSIVVLDDKIIEKPIDRDDAKKILRSLSGRSHFVYSAVVLLTPTDKTNRNSSEHSSPQVLSFFERTEVFFYELTDDMISAYVATGLPMDKAGAYGIQDGKASSFVTHIIGCYWNVTGFPVHAFCKHLLILLKEKKL